MTALVPIPDNCTDCRVLPVYRGRLYTICRHADNWDEQNKHCKFAVKSKYSLVCMFNRRDVIKDMCDCMEKKL